MIEPQKQALIIEAVAMGMDPLRAALAAGVNPAVHERWIELGTQVEATGDSSGLLDPSAVAYVAALEQASAVAELSALRAIRDPKTANPDAYRWLLERRFPDRWAKVPAAARAAQMKAEPAPPSSATPDDADPVDEIQRKREEKRRAAGGAGS